MQLNEILEKHRLWLEGEPNGERADLTGANLFRANLTRANLKGADLTLANLTGVNLTGVNLAGVNLRGANLTGSNLMSTRLDGSHVAGTEGVLSISTQNPHAMFAFMQDGELLITAGCRRGLTIEEAREHWAPENQEKWTRKTKEYGEIYLRAVDYLEAEAKALGWIE